MVEKEKSPAEQVPDVPDERECEAEELAESVAQVNEDEREADIEVEACGADLQEAQKEAEDYKNALIRERADFENYKKRNADLAGVSFRNGVESTVEALLPVLDNFERALEASCGDKAFVEGMEMIKRQLQDALTALGVEEIPIDGQFDPELHNAVMQVEEEGHPSNGIVETLQKGYKLNDKILRHAMVKVNK